MLLALLSGCTEPKPAPASAPEGAAVRALRFLKGAQEPDGSFRGGAFLPDEVATAYVLGLLSASETADPEIDSLLGRAAHYLLERQGEDGSFGDRLGTNVCLTSLTAFRRRLIGKRDPGQVGIEVLDPRHVARYFAAGRQDLAFEDFAVGPSSPGASCFHVLRNQEEPESRASLGRLLREGQRADGGWAGAPDVVETAFRLRALRLAPSGAVARSW